MGKLMWKQCVVFQALFAVVFFSGIACADEVILANGDKLTGTITEISDNILTLETAYSDPVKLKLEAVQQISSTEPVEIHLNNGEILKGKITATGSREVTIEAGPGREALVVTLDSVAALNPPPVKWKGNVTLGGNLQDGNTDTMNFSAGALAVRRTDKDRFLLNFLYNNSEENGDRTAENTYGQLKYDYYLNPVWYLYLNIDMLLDKFKDINLRTSVGPGVGYQVWDEDDKALAFEAGVSYTSEDRDEGEDTDWISARLGANFLYRLFARVIFVDQFVIYPNLDDTGEYTLRNEAAFLTDIGSSWAFKFSNIWERDSDPGPDLEKDDFTWILGLQYAF